MKSQFRLFNWMTQVFLALLGIACVLPAQAAYNYTSIDYPGVDYTSGGYTQILGINEKGELVGVAQLSGTSPTIPFVYNSKKSLFTVLPNFGTTADSSTASIGINNPGVVVGSETIDNFISENGFILDKGAFTIISNPGSLFFTVARAINSSGVVTGYADTGAGNFISGFIYDPKSSSFVDFLPSTGATIAQGINGRGDVVGSVYLFADGAYPGSPEGNYGFLRGKGGAIALFSVNGGDTHARGITDSGLIAGFVTITGQDMGFVGTLAGARAFQSLTVPVANLLSVPGSMATRPEGISNSGAVVGIWVDATGANHGFLARPVKH